MTENEAIERLKCMRLFMQINDKASESKFLEDDYIANKMAVKSLEEIQQYRSIGTVEEIKKVVRFLSLDNDNRIIKDIEELNKYKFIGTVEECKEAVERRKLKKVRISHGGVVRDRGKAYCPNCGLDIHGKGMIGACFRCGQAISWEHDNP